MSFAYSDERFADIQLLRYRLDGFEQLTPRQKAYVYYLSEATLSGRDITTDQFGKYNLRIRRLLELIFVRINSSNDGLLLHPDYSAFVVYLKRVWFSNGIYHHYGQDKFIPHFTEMFLRDAIERFNCAEALRLSDAEIDEICKVIFDPTVLPKRVNKADGADVVAASACNFYENVSQKEVEDFYAQKKIAGKDEQPSWGLNSKLTKSGGVLSEHTWKADGMYGKTIKKIIYWLERAAEVAENEKQKEIIKTLVAYYTTGDLRLFDEYSIEWLGEHEGQVDFINGFIEVYGDPLGLKGSWEGIVHYKDLAATHRTQAICGAAQWFEDNSPVDVRFKKKQVRGVTANVVCAAMLGGDEYPSTAIGINLPNADWIRAKYGSKSITIGNLTDAYNKAAKGNGMREEFVIDQETIDLINKYGDLCDDLHTDLHECVGHGSGRLLPGVDADALKSYGNTIEEARADLFGLYYIADAKLLELGLLPDADAYKSGYYTYMMNGLLTQMARIEKGRDIEEAHMRNRALIARWVLENGGNTVELIKRDGKTFVKINDYKQLRVLFGKLLAEIQRIKSEGDYDAARKIVETYGVKLDADLHAEVIERYNKLNLAPYKGFINPRLSPVFDYNDNITDVEVDYTETYEHQMLRYSSDYSFEN